VRLVKEGAPALKGATMSERRLDFLENHDWIRKALMFEPRGHDVMSGSMLYPSTRADCDTAILFIEVSGCLPMCGHGTIGTVTMAIENGLVTPKTPGVVSLDAPAGKVVARYDRRAASSKACASPMSRPISRRPTLRSTCRASASSPSTSPMAATTTPSSSRRRISRPGVDVGR